MDLQDYFAQCFEDAVAARDDDERKEFIKRVLFDSGTLQDWCEEIITDYHDISDGDPFCEAIINSVDWETVYDELIDQYPTEGDDVTEKDCVKCGEASHCGNYNDEKQWLCQNCEPESDSE